MVEIVMALAVAAAATLGFIQLSEDQDQRARAAMAAQQATTIGQAALSFINDRYADLLLRATAARPALVTVPDLVAAGYLPAGSNGRDSYGNTLCTLVLQVPGAPMARLQGLLVAEGGRQPLADVDLGRVVAGIGGAGGGIYSDVGATPGATIRGAGGGWEMPVAGPFSNANDAGRRCDGTAGAVALQRGRYMLALWHGKVFNNEDVLYRREVPGRADLNTMTTPLGLYVDVGAVRDVVFGRTCQQAGQLATDASGQLLNCKADSAGALQWTNTYAAGAVSFGANCTMAGAYALDSAGVPLVCRGGVWGNFYAAAPGVKVGATCVPALSGAFAMDSSGVPLVCKDNRWIFPLPTDDGSGGIAAGLPCRPNGSLAMGAAGRPLVCVGGEWRLFSDGGVPHERSYTSPGFYRFRVPDSVNELTVTLAGGGEAGGNTGNEGSDDHTGVFPGGSGGFIIDRVIRVTPGSSLDIAVGSGGLPSRGAGGTTWIAGGGTHVDLSCTGGGGRSFAGQAGHCNAEPHGGIGAWPTETNKAGFLGGQTPIRFGSGGHSYRCWNRAGSGYNCGWSRGGEGMSGAVFLRWREAA
ncbi:MAG: shufflon system plasmid conjugative transfer pilus tip adhesin PilV [Burkholderiales bacterium]|nr:shufflon system plasmid conjugative transfer pilus tip adhesin PilV [Burkholderiales bacterium]